MPQTHARGTSVLCLDLHKFGKTVAVAPDEVWWNSAAPLRSSAERRKRRSMRAADEWRGGRGEVLNLRGAVEHRGRTHGGTSVVCLDLHKFGKTLPLPLSMVIPLCMDDGMLETVEFYGGAKVEQKSLFFRIPKQDLQPILKFKAGLVFGDDAFIYLGS